MKCLIAGLMSVFVCSGISASPKPQPEKVLALKGTVIEAGTGKPLEFVTVALADTSGRVSAGATTDSTGTYSIRISDRSRSSMTNRLVFSLVGYKEKSFSFLDLEPAAGGRQDGAGLPGRTVRGGVMELGPVALEEDTQMLEGATVSGDRPLIEHQFDRLVLNVSELAVAQTGDALDVLKSSPGVTVDNDGNIKLNGSAVAVWIDGRPSNMSGTDLEAYLKGSLPGMMQKAAEGSSISRPGKLS